MMKKTLAALAVLLLTGCADLMNGAYHHVETALPSSWREGKAKPPAPVWPPKDWWEEFKSPELTRLIAAAEANNYDIAAAVARVKEADAQARIAGSPLLPSVGAGLNADHQKTPGSKSFNSLSATANAGYEIDFWGKNAAAYASAEATAEASRFDRETVALTTLSDVATTYFGIIGAEERLSVARQNLVAAEQILAAFRQRYQQGVSSALDVAQQQSVVDGLKAALPPLELQRRQEMDALAILIGKLPEAKGLPDGTKTTLSQIAAPAVIPGLPSELLLRRPDVQYAEAQLVSAHYSIANARAQFFPSIALTGEYGYASAALSSLFQPQSVLYSLAGSLTQPIFEGGLLEGQLEYQKARYEELLADYRKAALSAFSDVENSLAAVKQNAAAVAAQAQAVATARTAYELSERQLQGGVVDITTVLNTQRTLFAAEDSLAQARLQYLQSIVFLYQALGGGWKASDAVPTITLPDLPVP